MVLEYLKICFAFIVIVLLIGVLYYFVKYKL